MVENWNIRARNDNSYMKQWALCRCCALFSSTLPDIKYPDIYKTSLHAALLTPLHEEVIAFYYVRAADISDTAAIARHLAGRLVAVAVYRFDKLHYSSDAALSRLPGSNQIWATPRRFPSRPNKKTPLSFRGMLSVGWTKVDTCGRSNTPRPTGFAYFSLHLILKRITTERERCSSDAVDARFCTSPTHDCLQNSSSGIKASVWISPHPSLYCILLYNVTVDAYPSQRRRIKRSLPRRGGLSLRV